jgi:hypothetical protein
LEVPQKYKYLAKNAAQRDQSKSRKPKAAAVREAHKKALKVTKMHSKGKQRETELEEDPMENEDGVGEDGAGDFIQGGSKDGMDVDDEVMMGNND